MDPLTILEFGLAPPPPINLKRSESATAMSSQSSFLTVIAAVFF